jgi:hypothetical protein
MKVIDARSGDVVNVGDVVRYGPDDWWELLAIDEGLFSARALIYSPGIGRNGGRAWAPLRVRYTHPAFFLQKVAFTGT